MERRARPADSAGYPPAGSGPEATGIWVADPEQGRAVLNEAQGSKGCPGRARLPLWMVHYSCKGQ